MLLQLSYHESIITEAIFPMLTLNLSMKNWTILRMNTNESAILMTQICLCIVKAALRFVAPWIWLKLNQRSVHWSNLSVNADSLPLENQVDNVWPREKIRNTEAESCTRDAKQPSVYFIKGNKYRNRRITITYFETTYW